MKKKIFAGVMTAAMVLGSLTLPENISISGLDFGVLFTQATEAADSGTCGDNLTWVFDEGILTIRGSGEMENYEDDTSSPWGSNANIIAVVIENGATSIGDYAFSHCISLTSIEIPDSVTSIGDSAFYYCTGLAKVTFLGDSPEFGEDTFLSVTATAYYPANNSTWTEDVMQQYGGEITWVAYEADNSVGDADTESTYQCKMNELTEVPSSLSEKYDSVESLKTAMIASVTADDGYVEENTAVYDVVLMISADGDTTWQEATEEYFPENGITVTLSYPEGTDSSYDFVVAHMFTETSESLGTVAGEIEYPAVTKTDDGIQVTLKGLPPVAISWALSSSADDAVNNDGNTDENVDDDDQGADTDNVVLGDVNLDGYINYLDAMTALRYDAELISLSDEQLVAGDVNGDGSVDSLDAILILRYDAGLIESFE